MSVWGRFRGRKKIGPETFGDAEKGREVLRTLSDERSCSCSFGHNLRGTCSTRARNYLGNTSSGARAGIFTVASHSTEEIRINHVARIPTAISINFKWSTYYSYTTEFPDASKTTLLRLYRAAALLIRHPSALAADTFVFVAIRGCVYGTYARVDVRNTFRLISGCKVGSALVSIPDYRFDGRLAD